MEEDKENLISRKKQKKNLKEKREKMYQSINHECAKINTSEIRIEDFVESRKKELKNFNHILKSKYNSKSGFQLLPKHMRRRCMSHNPFRVPIRLRVGDIKTVIKTKQFKHKRKRRNLRKSILKRALLNNWFESHLWLVKRFKMKHKFGYLIPFKRRDKSFKACYRYFKYDAVLNDCSYFNYLTLRITNNRENPIEINSDNVNNNCENLPFLFLLKLFLDKLTLNKDYLKFTNDNPSDEEANKILQGFELKNFETTIYNFVTGELIGPCTLIILDGKLIIKFNALIANELAENLFNFKNKLFNTEINKKFKDISLEIHYSKSMNTYKLLGPRSGSRLFKVLNSLSGFDSFAFNEEKNEVLLENNNMLKNVFSNVIQFEKFLEEIPNGEVLFFKIKKPSTEFKMNEFCFNTFHDKLVKMKVEALSNNHRNENTEEQNKHMPSDEESVKRTKENNYLDFKIQIFAKSKYLLSDLSNKILNEESIELTELANLNIIMEGNNDKENTNVNYEEDDIYKSNNLSLTQRITSSFSNEKQKLINITQKKHLLRKFTAILNTYTERGPLVHRRKLNLCDLNEKVEESLHIDKRKIIDYFSLQKKSAHKNLNFSNNYNNNSEKNLYKIVNNIITENINNYKIEDIKKILHSQSESYLILLKNGLISLKNNSNNPNSSVFKSIPVYDLIFPSGFSSDLLRRFHYIETKVIGLKELNYFLIENGHQIFPDDYPSTKAYCQYIKNKTLSKIDKYCKYPPSKRSNFQKLCNPFPFYAAWETLAKMLKEDKKFSSNSIGSSDINDKMEIEVENWNNNINQNEKLITQEDYFHKFNFNAFNANSYIIENIKDKNSIKNQMEIQLLKNPKEKNLWVPIEFEMLAKGNPQYNALVCLPDEKDFQIIFDFLKFAKSKKSEKCVSNDINNKNNNDNKKLDFSKNMIINLLNNPMQKDFILDFESNKEIKSSIVQPVLKTEIRNKVFNTEYKIYKEMFENNNLHKLKYNSDLLDFNFNVKVDAENVERKIIGFVTTGQFSYSNHKGVGKGFINLKSFEEILKIKQVTNTRIKEELKKSMDDMRNRSFIEEMVRLNLLLIRNPGSRNYYFAKFTY